MLYAAMTTFGKIALTGCAFWGGALIVLIFSAAASDMRLGDWGDRWARVAVWFLWAGLVVLVGCGFAGIWGLR